MIQSVFGRKKNGFQRFLSYITFNERHLKTTFSDINKKKTELYQINLI